MGENEPLNKVLTRLSHQRWPNLSPDVKAGPYLLSYLDDKYSHKLGITDDKVVY
jgi:hypothetical protein